MKLMKNCHYIILDNCPTIWKKAMEKPSGPGDLSPAISFTTPTTSSSVKGSI
jgi:hypothetical protein